MNNSGKLSLPAAIIISSFVIGGFYFAPGFFSTWARSSCAEKAEKSAVEIYKESCEESPSSCPKDYDGKYLISDFKKEYETCLTFQGLK